MNLSKCIVSKQFNICFILKKKNTNPISHQKYYSLIFVIGGFTQRLYSKTIFGLNWVDILRGGLIFVLYLFDLAKKFTNAYLISN